MNCEKCKELLVAYVENLLPESQKQAVESHLNTCPPCRADADVVIGLRDRLAANGKAPARSDLENKVLNRILQEQSSKLREVSKSNKQIQLWRIIMKSRITKFAAAAVIIIGIILSMTLLNKTVAPAFGMNDVLAAIAQAEWMHITWDYAKVDAGSDLAEREINERWISVNPKRSITIYKDGSINFMDYLNDAVKAQEYDAETKMLTVRYRPASRDYPYATIVDMCLGGLSELEEKEGAKVEYAEGVYGGNSVKIINVDNTDDSGVHLQLSIIADDQTYLPICMTSLHEESGKSTTANAIFDYPEIGPTDIYQAGAPPDVEVRVIDYRPSCKFLEAIKPYRAARASLPKQLIVVEVANQNDNRSVVSVIYTSGIKERFEQLKYVRDDTAPDTNDFETILNWANSVKSDELAIQLNDGTTVYCVNRDYAGRWTSKQESTSRYGVGLVVAGLIHRGWPKIDLGKPVENNHTIENGLLCIETMREPSFADTKLAKPAGQCRAQSARLGASYSVSLRCRGAGHFLAPSDFPRRLCQETWENDVRKENTVAYTRAVSGFGALRQMGYTRRQGSHQIPPSWRQGKAFSTLEENFRVRR